MSEVSEAATVRLLLADYAVADPAAKINALGAGLTVMGINVTSGLTAGFSLIVQIGVPSTLYNAECSVEVLLEDSGGGLVGVPLATGLPQQSTQPIRIGQVVRFDPPRLPAPVSMPSSYLPARVQFVLNFTMGLPLMPGQGYGWRVKLDDASRDDWVEKFVVIGPPTGPVIG